MQEIINVINQKRQEITAQLSKNIEKTDSIGDLIHELGSWNKTLDKEIVACTESVKTDIAPVFNRSYQSDAEILASVSNAFDKTEIHSNKLITLLHLVKKYYGTYEENKVINAFAAAIESVLKDLQIFYMSIDDALQNDSTSGNIEFKPDITIPFTIISNYISEQSRNIQEQNTAKVSKSSGIILPLLAGFGLGLFFGNDDGD